MKRIAITLLTIALSGGVLADAFERGGKAFLRGDYSTALSSFQSAAEQGRPEAQLGLGVMYAVGKGVPQNFAEAVKWYRLAAEQGDATAQYSLGVMYDKGLGVPQDYAQAVKWWRLAAEQGHAAAQEMLGGMYAIGKGVPQDFAEGYAWLNVAAAQGGAKAIELRDLAAEALTPAELAKAQALSAEYHKRYVK